ncbi:MAG: hypothetical protein PF495_16250 [Spirochaetales bacterium]|jgi:hypothetical protein|nr:hypothetical protein [Spirochaetales bacterium]
MKLFRCWVQGFVFAMLFYASGAYGADVFIDVENADRYSAWLFSED